MTIHNNNRKYIHPVVSGLERATVVQLASQINLVPVDSIVDAVTITTHYCDGCGLPHVLKISSTTSNQESVVAIMSMAITDILDTYYDANPDDIHTAWGESQ
jgi:hypothetical protein